MPPPRGQSVTHVSGMKCYPFTSKGMAVGFREALERLQAAAMGLSDGRPREEAGFRIEQALEAKRFFRSEERPAWSRGAKDVRDRDGHVGGVEPQAELVGEASHEDVRDKHHAAAFRNEPECRPGEPGLADDDFMALDVIH